MQFKFDPDQEFQLEAIQAISDIFEGHPRLEAPLEFKQGNPSIANQLCLVDEQLLANVQAIQSRQQVYVDAALQYLSDTVENEPVRFANFSIEMETGTGKTYVYIRTALELYQRYGFLKFIIVVPSVAIREGVLKTFQITQTHLKALYNQTPYRYYNYDSENIAQVRQFALANSVEFMVMTLAAFNKANINVVHQSTDRLQGAVPIHLIQSTRPILILDEPQNMESEKSIMALASLHPLFALRYSATHRVPYNLVYRLSPAEAYRRRLVKRIEVAATTVEGDTNRPYIKLLSVHTQKRTLTARLMIDQLRQTGQLKRTTLTVKASDSLQKRANRAIYDSYTISLIEITDQRVTFANGQTLTVGQELEANRTAIFESQIRYTLLEHFRKQAELRPLGIKVLSLFFIDKVANYAPANGVGFIRQLFEQIYHELCPADAPAADQVQAAYFAQHTTKQGQTLFEDSKTGTSQRDKEAYDKIMRHKEQLLSLNDPTAFIFSHSALREGWDNPNVFQICTLNQSQSEVRKRQEIGRGIRLAVNQQGERIQDERINILTVVANESYEQFVLQLQEEINAEYKKAIEARYHKSFNELSLEERKQAEQEFNQLKAPLPPDARTRRPIKLRGEVLLKPEFQELWEQIKPKTRYAIQLDTPALIAQVVAELSHYEILPPRVTVTKAAVEVTAQDEFAGVQTSTPQTFINLAPLNQAYPNLVALIIDLLTKTRPPIRLSRATILEIIRQAPQPQAIIQNPTEFATLTARIIKQKLATLLIEGVRYEKTGEWYNMELLAPEFMAWPERLQPSKLGVYDYVSCDSETERTFVKDLDNLAQIKFYLKLPAWFTVPTPIGNYNPDWAIAMEAPNDPSGTNLYFIGETKGTTDKSKLPYVRDGQKIKCGYAHFRDTLGVQYQVMRTIADLPRQKLTLVPQATPVVTKVPLNFQPLRPIIPPQPSYAAELGKRMAEIKEQADWRCEQCGRDCFRDRFMLEVHHINGDRTANNFPNVVALCKVCRAVIAREFNVGQLWKLQPSLFEDTAFDKAFPWAKKRGYRLSVGGVITFI